MNQHHQRLRLRACVWWMSSRASEVSTSAGTVYSRSRHTVVDGSPESGAEESVVGAVSEAEVSPWRPSVHKPSSG